MKTTKIILAVALVGILLAGLIAGFADTRLVVNKAGNLSTVPVEYGTVTASADGTVTNTFSSYFSSAPTVVLAQNGTDTTITNIVTVTTAQFIWNAGAPSATARWIAIGE